MSGFNIHECDGSVFSSVFPTAKPLINDHLLQMEYITDIFSLPTVNTSCFESVLLFYSTFIHTQVFLYSTDPFYSHYRIF